nr:hypothetical protein [Desulfobacula sp.]
MKSYRFISGWFFLSAVSILMFPVLLRGADFPLTMEDTANNPVYFYPHPNGVCLAPISPRWW